MSCWKPARQVRRQVGEVSGPATSERIRSDVRVPLAAVVFAAGLFFYLFTRSRLWLDEALSVDIARLPLTRIPDALRHDGAPPLYYFLLHVWTSVFGTGDLASRSLSGVCMAAAVVTVWFVARRVGGTDVAWLSALFMASNPYAIRYATEARMYALMILLVSCGLLAFQRTREAPSIGRAATFGLVVALGVYTQYWAFYLLVVVVGLLIFMTWRVADRRAFVLLGVATAVGVATFIPWLPTFLYQRQHTGTPWGVAITPALPIAYTIRDFAGGAVPASADQQESVLLLLIVLPLLALGVFGRAIDDRRIAVDLRVQPRARLLVVVGALGLATALTLNYLAGNAFVSRYSAIVFPFFVVLVALGLATLRHPRIRAGVLAVLVLLGFAGGVRNVVTQRTQAGEVARVLHADARAGDVVIYCPDQLGPSVHRLVPPGLDEVVFPSYAGPERVDWVDYKQRIMAADVRTFAAQVLARAGSRTVWLVLAPAYVSVSDKCNSLSDFFAAARSRVQRTRSDGAVFEEPALQQFRPSADGP